jgi:hypothetical protein
MVLRDIRDMVHSMGKDMRDYGLPPICDLGGFSIDMMREVREEHNMSIDQEHINIYEFMKHLTRSSMKDLMKSFSMYLLIKAKYFS